MIGDLIYYHTSTYTPTHAIHTHNTKTPTFTPEKKKKKNTNLLHNSLPCLVGGEGHSLLM